MYIYLCTHNRSPNTEAVPNLQQIDVSVDNIYIILYIKYGAPHMHAVREEAWL